MKQILLYFFISALTLATAQNILSTSIEEERTFTVDYENNKFLKDGQPFRFVGGSFHYFRALPQTWRAKLRTMRAAGLNVVTTYVEWALHNPKESVYDWSGIANLEQFIQLAQEEDLLVILRPGPYICAERDNGGFPFWLFTKYPGIKFRTSDSNYLAEFRIWYEKLMPRMQPLLYGNGGNIIMVQVENEYGSFSVCDRPYQRFSVNITEKYVQGKAVLFTNDGSYQLRCGKIPGVLATLDFGSGSDADIDKNWRVLRRYQPKGPLVNAEYYPGWLTHWQEKMARVDIEPIVKSFTKMMDDPSVSVNFYMFFGGTNFGFTAGANGNGVKGDYQADLTSYDYDAPMDEAGDPTYKFEVLRNAISKYLPLPNLPFPTKAPKMTLPPMTLNPTAVVLSENGRSFLAEQVVSAEQPMSFEQLGQYSGFVLYETDFPPSKMDPNLLNVTRLGDRAYVYVDRHYVGVLSRENNILTMPISAGMGNRLQLFVENQGRINFNIADDIKGILGDVLLNGVVLKNWSMTSYPFENYENIEAAIRDHHKKARFMYSAEYSKSFLKSGATLFHGEFQLTNETIYDTYMDMTGWGKGVAFINGFNLGRYWPLVGPQITLYVPKEILKTGSNTVVLLELQNAPLTGQLIFTDTPNLDG